MSDVAQAKIKSKIFIRGKMIVLTGLHIGGNSVGMSIGGADKVVVRNPLDNVPYVPGSSLRGKMRSLMERLRGHEDDPNNGGKGGFSWDERKKEAIAGKKGETQLGQLFGITAAHEEKGKLTATRLIVRDAMMTKETVEKLQNAPNTDMPMTEVKTEVFIDRITSGANPRQIERIPAGAEFTIEFILTLLQEDEKETFLDLIQEGLLLLEADALGGSGGRGYGQVKFLIEQIEEKTAQNYFNGDKATPITHKMTQLFSSELSKEAV
ncbi:type III-A CRISPR-associated RAMP protein Csm3 [Thioflexithrix psekupsensis]|uniref:CRISPR system Cms endoribonuclease Csm3 n=1 Tax=Thioflexithrix psekupsensis TaxID=1570016 RepID=A0A251X914_9GAMM|nr:type III-A CRISPR-associated RAMP protein Csm3 [Thioflexithrix psekupsensis]OUD14217.1 type III-A CRISPR-associated RAMP protein Csm3 [Thioflexithrix psekupsensis]